MCVTNNYKDDGRVALTCFFFWGGVFPEWTKISPLLSLQGHGPWAMGHWPMDHGPWFLYRSHTVDVLCPYLLRTIWGSHKCLKARIWSGRSGALRDAPYMPFDLVWQSVHVCLVIRGKRKNIPTPTSNMEFGMAKPGCQC